MQIDPDLQWFDPNIPGFCALTGPYEFARTDDGRSLMRMTIAEQHLNAGGVCHGGAIVTLADMAMGFTAHVASGHKMTATMQLESKFLSAGKLGDVIIAEAALTRHVRDICFVECVIWSGERKLFTASGVWKVLTDTQKGESLISIQKAVQTP